MYLALTILTSLTMASHHIDFVVEISEIFFCSLLRSNENSKTEKVVFYVFLCVFMLFFLFIYFFYPGLINCIFMPSYSLCEDFFFCFVSISTFFQDSRSESVPLHPH